jgi:hypothetical protein
MKHSRKRSEYKVLAQTSEEKRSLEGPGAAESIIVHRMYKK